MLTLVLFLAAIHTSNAKGKGNCHQNDQSKNAENTSYVPSQKASGRTVSLNPAVAGRSPNLTYNKAGAIKESKMSLPGGRHLVSFDFFLILYVETY